MHQNVHQETNGDAGFALCDTAGFFSLYPANICQVLSCLQWLLMRMLCMYGDEAAQILLFDDNSNATDSGYTELVRNLPVPSSKCSSVSVSQVI